jgi:hypothetical protein
MANLETKKIIAMATDWAVHSKHPQTQKQYPTFVSTST